MLFNRRSCFETTPCSQDARSLRIIGANDNLITKLTAAMFEGLTYLYTLAMARNKITELQTGVFRDMSELANLHLDSNRITTVQPGVFPVEDGITYDLGLVYRVQTSTTQRRLRIFSMRYNPTKCWVGIKDYSNPGSTVAIFNDFNAHCDCAEGLVHNGMHPFDRRIGLTFALLAACCGEGASAIGGLAANAVKCLKRCLN